MEPTFAPSPTAASLDVVSRVVVPLAAGALAVSAGSLDGLPTVFLRGIRRGSRQVTVGQIARAARASARRFMAPRDQI